MTCDLWWLWLLLLWTNPFILFEVLSIPGTVLPPGYSLWLFSYKPFMWCRSYAWLWHAVIYLIYKPFMWYRSDARLWHAVIYLLYKPFMWCCSDARLWHAVIYLPYEPFMWCRSDARLRHARYLLSFRGVASDTRLVHFITTLLLHIHVAYK